MVVVIARKAVEGGTELLVVPITTQQPRNLADGFEVPTRVKAHLGLDAERCWIMVTELNRFLWPGPDIRLVGRGPAATPFYGYIPQQLFDSVLAAIVARAKTGRVAITKRST